MASAAPPGAKPPANAAPPAEAALPAEVARPAEADPVDGEPAPSAGSCSGVEPGSEEGFSPTEPPPACAPYRYRHYCRPPAESSSATRMRTDYLDLPANMSHTPRERILLSAAPRGKNGVEAGQLRLTGRTGHNPGTKLATTGEERRRTPPGNLARADSVYIPRRVYRQSGTPLRRGDTPWLRSN
jgi:hypothetical protein